MALEDAAVLGSLLSHLSSSAHVPHFLRAYEKLRHTRTSKTQASSRLNQHVFHLPNGVEQEQRDADMRAAMAVELARIRREEEDAGGEQGAGVGVGAGVEEAENEGNANQWADRKKNVEQFSYDADAAAEQWWVNEGEALVRKLGQQQQQQSAL